MLDLSNIRNNQQRERLRGHGAMALFALLIAGSFSFGSRMVLHIDPMAVTAVRFICASLLLGTIVYASSPARCRQNLCVPRAFWRFLILGALMAIYFISMFIALEITNPVSTGAVFTLMPLLSAGFGYLILRQLTAGPELVALLVAGAGAIWVIFRGDIEVLRAFDLGKGEMIYLIGTVMHAIYAVLVKKFNRGEAVLYFTFWTILATTAWVILFAFPSMLVTSWGSLPAIVWIGVAYLAIFTTAGTFFLLQYAIMRIPAGKATAYIYLTPTYIILIEGLIGNGWANLSVFLGAAIIVGSLVFLVFTSDA